MPLPLHQVVPVRLSDSRIPAAADNKLETVTNTTLCQAIRQLASLLRQADQLFTALGEEVVTIQTRTEGLGARVATLATAAHNYDPRKQPIPAGDLATFSKLKQHYKTDYGLTTDLFTRDTRPRPIRTLYEAARDTTQPEVQRDVSGMMMMPYFSDTEKRNNFYLDVETCLPRDYEEFTRQLAQDQRQSREGEVVTVDVSGATLQRMADYRRSLQPAAVTTRRKRRQKNRDRRNTLAGGEKIHGDTGAAAIRENKNRSRSQEDGRLAAEGRLKDDSCADTEDVSLNATRCSSSLLTAGSCAAPDTSANTSHDTERTQLSDSAAPCPPNMPLLLHGEAELRRLRLTLSPGRGSALLSPGSCSDKDRDAESCYETLASVARRSVTKRSGTDGALSSSGVWTASVSEGSDKEEDTAAAAEVRPKSSLSLGVVSSDGETRGEEEGGSPALLQEAAIPFMDEADVSVHSCDTEGYYTTFHDFDGFQEVAHEYDFGAGAADGDSEPAAEAEGETAEPQAVVYRKKAVPGGGPQRPSPPRRHSSLVKDRESLDTVVSLAELQQRGAAALLDLSSDATETDMEVSGHLGPSAQLTARYIPALCVVTPPASDTASVNVSRSPTQSPAPAAGSREQPGSPAPSADPAPAPATDIVCHRLSVSSSASSDVTTHSGKLVSITPDIVKPSKEQLPGDGDGGDGDAKTVSASAAGVVASASGGQLPDMLSHTPDTADCEAADTVRHAAATKLRITSPFAAYRDGGARQQAEDSPAAPPPSTLPSQGEQPRGEPRPGAPPPPPGLATSRGEEGGDAASALKRSDSYRSARTILSPDLSKLSRKSPEISPSNKIENATYVSFTNITSSSDKSPELCTLDSLDTTPDTGGHGAGAAAGGGKHNFFKSLRSQFSSLSLRRKPASAKKRLAAAQQSPVLAAAGSKQTARRNSFSSLLHRSPAAGARTPPRLTSTPISGQQPSPRPRHQGRVSPRARRHPVTAWSSDQPRPGPGLGPQLSPAPPPGPQQPRPAPASPPRFRTAALKHQYELQLARGPSTACYAHAPPPYQPPPPHQPPYCQGAPPLQPLYYNTSQPASQRSSVSSIYGMYQGPASSNSLYSSLQRVAPSPGPRDTSRDSCDPRDSPPHSVAGSDAASVSREQCGGGCPMCYHSLASPCTECGCPSSRLAATSSLSLSNVRLKPPGQNAAGAAGDFISPSSDYHSLSPASPPPDPPQPPAWAQPQPVYAAVVRSKGGLQSGDPISIPGKGGRPPGSQAAPGLARSGSAAGRRPAAPVLGMERGDSRRHSWAGDKRGPVSITPKKTSLHDFKKLLAQQSPGQNPHRVSAREMLERSAAPAPSPAPGTAPGPRSKRTSPWVDKRFSVIQEEAETGSRETLLE